jgi:hypothetical protein
MNGNPNMAMVANLFTHLQGESIGFHYETFLKFHLQVNSPKAFIYLVLGNSPLKWLIWLWLSNT